MGPGRRAAPPRRRLVAIATFVVAAGALAGATSVVSTAKGEPGAPDVLSASGSLYNVVDQIGARALWERGVTGKGVAVAVIDTGIAGVAALGDPGKVIAAVDLSGESSVPEARFDDTFGHGTHMSGIIAGHTPGADPLTAKDHPEWFLGVAPDAALVSVKVGDNTGAVDVSQVIAGIDWVVENGPSLGVRVINLSYGTDSTQPYGIDPLAAAVERAWQAGFVVVVSTGNDGRGTKRLANPASDPYVIAVAAAEVSGREVKVPSWVTSGDGVRNPDVSAPGAHILSLRNPGSRADLEYPSARVGEELFLGSGSSQAAAVVSGAAALLLSDRPELTPDAVKALLIETADPRGKNQVRFQGAGLIDVAAAASRPITAAAQTWRLSDGSGSLEESRGSHHVNVNGYELSGEFTVNGAPWSGASWSGDRWSGASWSGASWSAASWRGASWSGASWSGASWSGASWSGASWSGARWAGASWSGASWSGASWSGASWSGASWSGASWSDSAWS